MLASETHCQCMLVSETHCQCMLASETHCQGMLFDESNISIAFEMLKVNIFFSKYALPETVILGIHFTAPPLPPNFYERCVLNIFKVVPVFSKIKACVLHFLTNVYFSLNDNPSKTMKDVFYFP